MMTAMPRSRNTAAKMGPSESSRHRPSRASDTVTAVSTMSSVLMASVFAVRPEWT